MKWNFILLIVIGSVFLLALLVFLINRIVAYKIAKFITHPKRYSRT